MTVSSCLTRTTSCTGLRRPRWVSRRAGGAPRDFSPMLRAGLCMKLSLLGRTRPLSYYPPNHSRFISPLPKVAPRTCCRTLFRLMHVFFTSVRFNKRSWPLRCHAACPHCMKSWPGASTRCAPVGARREQSASDPTWSRDRVSLWKIFKKIDLRKQLQNDPRTSRRRSGPL